MLHSPLQQAAAGGQVHDVVLVDPGRAGQQRDLVHLLGLRRVLDQLHELVAEDDLALGRGQVLAEPERPPVDLLRPAAVVGQVVGEVTGPGQHAGAAGLERPLQRGRVGEQVVRRGECVAEQAADQLGLPVGHRLGRTGRQQVVAVLPGRQVRLPQREERRVLFPGRIREPAVLRIGGQGGLRLHPQPPGKGDLADLGEAGPEPEARRGDLGRVRCCPGQHGRHRAGKVAYVHADGGQASLRAPRVACAFTVFLVVVVGAHRHLQALLVPSTGWPRAGLFGWRGWPAGRGGEPASPSLVRVVRRSRRCPGRRRCTWSPGRTGHRCGAVRRVP